MKLLMLACFQIRFVTVNSCLSASRITQYCEGSAQCKRSERLAQDFTTDPVDHNARAVPVCDTTHDLTQLLEGGINDLIESKRLRLLAIRLDATELLRRGSGSIGSAIRFMTSASLSAASPPARQENRPLRFTAKRKKVASLYTGTLCFSCIAVRFTTPD